MRNFGPLINLENCIVDRIQSESTAGVASTSTVGLFKICLMLRWGWGVWLGFICLLIKWDFVLRSFNYKKKEMMSDDIIW